MVISKHNRRWFRRTSISNRSNDTKKKSHMLWKLVVNSINLCFHGASPSPFSRSIESNARLKHRLRHFAQFVIHKVREICSRHYYTRYEWFASRNLQHGILSSIIIIQISDHEYNTNLNSRQAAWNIKNTTIFVMLITTGTDSNFKRTEINSSTFLRIIFPSGVFVGKDILMFVNENQWENPIGIILRKFGVLYRIVIHSMIIQFWKQFETFLLFLELWGFQLSIGN